jgi:DNA polymerase III delta prime subunit|tara:strand:+ start:1206 stop:2141 length:936 start_codon:yes stop_codon:yes gene_type:complete
MEQFIWVEKYRPKTVDECILTDELAKTFNSFVSKGIPNLILCGGPGVGKTTVAKAMLEQCGSDYIMINGSMRGNIDTLRTDIQSYASTTSLDGSRKYIILDEADYLNPQSTQPALRGFIEEFHNNCGFIMTCNYVERLLEPLRSRCSVVNFSMQAKEKPELAKQFFKRVIDILSQENVKYDKNVLQQLIIENMPDWRKVLNDLQRYSSAGVIDTGILIGSDPHNLASLYEYCEKKNFSKIRQWVSSALSISDSVNILSAIEKEFSQRLNPKYVPNLIVTLAEYQFKTSFVANQEINLTAFLVEVMSNCFDP